MHRMLFGVGHLGHPGHAEDQRNQNQEQDLSNRKWNLHRELERQLAVPPSQNSFYKFLHAVNKTKQNNMRPAVGEDGTGLSGCWLICTPVEEVDEAWAKVKEATEAGKLGYKSNVRTVKDDSTDAIFISVCTYNAFDVEDVLRVRHALYNLGFTADTGDDNLEYKTLKATDEEIHYEDHDRAYVSLHRDFKLI